MFRKFFSLCFFTFLFSIISVNAFAFTETWKYNCKYNEGGSDELDDDNDGYPDFPYERWCFTINGDSASIKYGKETTETIYSVTIDGMSANFAVFDNSDFELPANGSEVPNTTDIGIVVDGGDTSYNVPCSKTGEYSYLGGHYNNGSVGVYGGCGYSSANYQYYARDIRCDISGGSWNGGPCNCGSTATLNETTWMCECASGYELNSSGICVEIVESCSNSGEVTSSAGCCSGLGLEVTSDMGDETDYCCPAGEVIGMWVYDCTNCYDVWNAEIWSNGPSTSELETNWSIGPLYNGNGSCVACPSNSSPDSVVKGCKCNSGYENSVTGVVGGEVLHGQTCTISIVCNPSGLGQVADSNCGCN